MFTGKIGFVRSKISLRYVPWAYWSIAFIVTDST